MNMDLNSQNKVQQVLQITRFLCSELKNETEIGRIALISAIHNRMLKGEHISSIWEDADFSARGVWDGTGKCDSAVEFIALLSHVAGVFAGLYSDPTKGATRFHRHNRSPNWARNRQSTALLGERLYYRL